MKKFVVVPGKKYYFFNEIKDEDIYIEEEYFVSSKNKLLSNIQKVSKKVGLWPIYYLFTKSWKDKILECDNCIIFDQGFSVSLVKSIKRLNPHINIIIYFWNPIFNNDSKIEKIKTLGKDIKLYSFDKKDCSRYNIDFAPMLYNFDSYFNYEQKVAKYDVIFVGYLKNRIKMLTEIYNELERQSANAFFYVLDNINTNENVPFELHCKYMSYDDYRINMLQSKAVLDIVQDGQIGLTIRTMETIRYHRKLITNNKDIINYDFYNKQNIFVLGIDNLNDLSDFIKTPFCAIDEDILRKYNFTDWVKSFI